MSDLAITVEGGKTKKLLTAGKYCDRDVLVTADASVEDTIANRTVTEYTNDRITEVGDSAFQSAKALTAVSFTEATYIKSYAFNYCSNLVSVNVPKAEIFANGCFTNCTALETVSLPSAKKIYNYTFSNCTKLTNLLLPGATVPTVQSSLFTGTKIAGGTGYIYVNDDLVDSYKTATNWSVLADQIRPISEWEE